MLQHDLSIVFDEETFQKEMLNPFYKDHSIIDDDIILIGKPIKIVKTPPHLLICFSEKYKESIQLNRPVQISAAILELAKAEMYRYWYKGEAGIDYNISSLKYFIIFSAPANIWREDLSFVHRHRLPSSQVEV